MRPPFFMVASLPGRIRGVGETKRRREKEEVKRKAKSWKKRGK